MVGKWHLGHHRRQFLPIFRGFESHVGYWTGKKDYYDHTNLCDVKAYLVLSRELLGLGLPAVTVCFFRTSQSSLLHYFRPQMAPLGFFFLFLYILETLDNEFSCLVPLPTTLDRGRKII